jgi:hypothetical protein
VLELLPLALLAASAAEPVSLTLAQNDVAETSETSPPQEPSPEERPPELRYSLTNSTRVQVGSGVTVVSAETGTPVPRTGYFPLRVFVDNGAGPRQRMRLSYESSVSGAPPVTKTLELAPGERRTVSLIVPSAFVYGRLEVHAPGVTERGSEPLYFSPLQRRVANYGTDQRLVLSLGAAEEFEQAVGTPALHTPAEMVVLAIPPEEAPAELAAYVGFDAVAIPKAGLDALSEGARRALEAYAATGGEVLAANAGRAMTSYFPLEKIDEGKRSQYGLGHVRFSTSGSKLDLIEVRDAAAHHDPAVLPNGVTEGRRRHEPSVASALLPQATPPLGSFFGIIFVFTLLIGPGSIFVARMRGPTALLVTIPGTAFVTCGLIVCLSILKDGFVTHASSHGYTELDSRRHRAFTAGVTAYYANLSPSSARFDTLTAVLGSSGPGEGYGAGMDWGESATAGSDFLPSRTYREWGFLSVEPTRARVMVRHNGTSWLVQNALGADAERLTVSTKDGYFEVQHLRDDAEAVAQPVASPTLPIVREDAEPRFGDAMLRFGEAMLSHESRPLAQGEFLAEVKGLGFLPSGGLRLAHHDSWQIVRGEVE